MAFMKAHQILGHAGPKLTIETSRALGYKVRMKDKKCRFCGKAKSKQKNLKKKTNCTANERGIRLLIDITSSKTRSIGNNKYWLAIMDEGTDMIWCEFLKSKDENCDKVYNHLMKMKGWGIDINKLTIRCDNAPENYSLKKKTELNGLGTRYEFTARGTPQ